MIPTHGTFDLDAIVKRFPATCDSGRRDPRDITFVDPSDGTPDTFIATRKLY